MKYINISIMYFFLLIFGFMFSWVFLDAYEFGDQIHYREFYSALEDVSFSEIPMLQLRYTGSSEPIFGLISWMGSKLYISKGVYFSVINAFFYFVLVRFLVRHEARKVFIVLSLINFYVFVMIGPAERLKVAFLLMMIAVSMESLRFRVAVLATALLTHFQILIFIGAWAVGRFPEFSTRYFSKKANIISAAAASIALYIFTDGFISIYFDALILKFENYQGYRGFYSLFQVMVLVGASILVFQKNKLRVVATLLGVSVAVLTLGPERVNMIAVVFFLFFAIKEKKTGHPIVLMLMAYFAIKGVIFVLDVFNFGTGF